MEVKVIVVLLIPSFQVPTRYKRESQNTVEVNLGDT
jgi:hypothetical protein